MRKSLVIGLLFAIFAITPQMKAQEQTSKLELYGGYAYVRYNASPRITGVPLSESFNANGASGQIEFNANNWLGLVADVTGYSLARRGFTSTNQISYLFGPRINRRRGKVTPFGQVLLGREWAKDGIVFGPVTAFAMMAGGGVDYAVSRHFAVRPVEAEYFLTKFPDGNNERQNNFRYSAGIIFRFGGK